MYVHRGGLAVHRTQIYLSESQRRALSSLARRLGRTRSDVIRTALDRFLQAHTPSERLDLLRQARGLWKSRRDLPDFRRLREESDRISR
jgi:Arc/MetJ-type ribon-helix-helix transcriptional regulator